MKDVILYMVCLLIGFVIFVLPVGYLVAEVLPSKEILKKKRKGK